MTPQQIFNKVAKHLLSQRRPSVDSTVSHGQCMYRGPNGLKCAIGALIPNKMYRPQMERNDIGLLMHSAQIGVYSVPDYFADNISLLSDLQHVHDMCSLSVTQRGTFRIHELRSFLRQVAIDFDLEFKQ